jgi:uncharacterized protein YjbJ (UPF0337 family)
MANEDQVKGTAKEWLGKGQQVAGDLTDDPELKAKGEDSELEGKTQNVFGKAKETIKDAVDTVKDKLEHLGHNHDDTKDSTDHPAN